MSYNAKMSAQGELRREARSELFLSAMLEEAHGSRPVRIRNISSGGALVDADRPPAINADVQLIRAHLKVQATVAWSEGSRCGLKFRKPISTEYWVPSLSAQRQMEVDRRLEDIRRGLVNTAGDVSEQKDPNTIRDRVAEEIAALGRGVEQALDELATFAPLVVRMPHTMQQLEIVAQSLGHLGRVLSEPDSEAAVHKIGMEDLKRRLLR